MNEPLIAFAGLAALCGICQWLSWRFMLPSILFLLTAGILVGPIFGLFDPDAFLGELLFPFVSVAVAIILFEGGLTLKLGDIRGHGSVVTRLISVGVLITWVLLTVAAHFIFGISWELAMVFGSICVVSGPTVVKPLLRSVRPSDKVGHILNWEGILIDPVGVFLALLVFDFVLLTQPGSEASGSGYVGIALILVKLVVIGTAVGAAFGWASAYALRRYLIPDYLVNVTMLAVVVCAFVLAETLQHESGLLAVTIMGVWLANKKGVHVEELLHFKEDLSVLLISGLFIVLAARIDIGVIPQYGLQILLLLAVAQFFIRPLNAWLCTIGSGLSFGERAFLCWIAPRGIVAAAVSSLFVLRLEEVGMADAELLVPLVFSMIIGTVVFQSLTAKPLAAKLGIGNPEPNGVLFFGANDIAVALASVLRAESIRVRLSDTSWRNVRAARQAGLEAYHGNPTSGHAAENLDLQGIGKLIAVSSHVDTNALAGMHFRKIFGSNAVFTLGGASDDDAYERFSTANRNRANPLFEQTLSHSGLARRLREGEVRRLELRDEPVQEPADEPLEEDDGTATDESPSEQSIGRSPEVLSMASGRSSEERPPEETSRSTGGRADGAGGNEAGQGTDDTDSADASGAGTAGEGDTTSTPGRQVSGDTDAFDGAEESTREAVLRDENDSPIAETDLRLFAIDPNGRLYVYGAGEAFTPRSGWRVIVLSEKRAEATPEADGESAAA